MLRSKDRLDVLRLRKDFPMLKQSMNGKPLVYLDSAATAQKPQVVIDAISDFYSTQYATVHRAVYSLSSSSTERYLKARRTIQNFIHAKKPEEVIFTRGTTDAINLVAFSYGRKFIHPGDRILVSQMEHHSNIVPWQILAEERQASLQVIPVNQRGEVDLSSFKKQLESCPKIVAICHVSNALGTINPLAEMIALAHSAGAVVVVDGAQAIPHLPVNVQKLGADFYAFSGHKLFGPTGIGVLYGKEHLLE